MVDHATSTDENVADLTMSHPRASPRALAGRGPVQRRPASFNLTATIAAICFWANTAIAADPDFLRCTVGKDKPTIKMVVFRQLKTIRVWYADGHGEDWTGVNFNKSIISTAYHKDRNIVLSDDFQTVILNTEGRIGQHVVGACSAAPTAGEPKYMFDPNPLK